jgi:hypothetical protein
VLDNPHPGKYALCPCCQGTGRKPVDEANQKWKLITAGYDKETDTFACTNCGGQTMSGRAYGWTLPNPATGEGCKHEYNYRSGGRCYHLYTCKHCSHHFDIDSGD